MKKLFLVLCLILSGLLLKSQIAKGTKMIGTRLNYFQNNSDNNTANYTGTATYINHYRSFSGSVNGGFFLKDNLVIGLVFGYGNQFSEYGNKQQGGNFSETINSSGSTTFSLGLYGRVYKMMKENQFGFFGNMDVLYSFGESNTKYITNNSGAINNQSSIGDITGYSLSLSPGVVFFITQHIGLEASFGNLTFRNQTTESTYNNGITGTDKVNGINFNFSVSSLNVGINFYLSHKKS